MKSLSFSCLGPTMLVAALAGCGGRVIFDTSSGTGSGGAATQTTTHATTGSAKASTGVGSTTVGNAVSVAASTGTSPNSCLNFGFQGINAPCSQEGLSCQVPFACCGMNAICKGGVWRAEGPLCNQPCLMCGQSPFGCETSAVCVIDQLGTMNGPSFHCAKDPCPPGQLSCACAAPLCQQSSLSCSTANPSTVVCDCPNCGG